MEHREIKFLLIDDSLQARNLLKFMLQEYAPDFIFSGEADNGVSGLSLIQKVNPDVVFLDIEMPGKSGIQLVEELLRMGIKCNVIFTTAYNKYAITAFRLSAIDYLLKPIKEKELLESIERIRERLGSEHTTNYLKTLVSNISEQRPTKVSIPTLNGYDVIDLENIIYIKAEGAYSQVFFDDGTSKLYSKNLKYFEGILTDLEEYCRIHRSTIVHIGKIVTYNVGSNAWIEVNYSVKLEIARERKTQFLEQFSKFKQTS